MTTKKQLAAEEAEREEFARAAVEAENAVAPSAEQVAALYAAPEPEEPPEEE